MEEVVSAVLNASAAAVVVEVYSSCERTMCFACNQVPVKGPQLLSLLSNLSCLYMIKEMGEKTLFEILIFFIVSSNNNKHK